MIYDSYMVETVLLGKPCGWTIYGLVASRFGDIEDKMESGEPVKQFVKRLV